MNRRYAILHINDAKGFKGGERQMMYLAFALRLMGHWNCIVCRQGSLVDMAAEEAGFDRLYLPFAVEWDPVSWLLLGNALKDLGERKEYDRIILHSHTSHAAGIAALASKNAGEAGAIRVVTRREDIPVTSNLSLRNKYMSAHRIIAVSSRVKEVLAEKGVKDDSISVVQDCVPSTGFPWDGCGLPAYRKQARADFMRSLVIPKEHKVIGCLTPLEKTRNPGLFLQAAAETLKLRPCTHFLMAGNGPLARKMELEARTLGLGQQMHFMSHVPEPLGLMASLDALCIHNWGEGSGGLALEAMAAGTLVCAPETLSSLEIAENAKNAALFENGNPVSMAAALCRALNDTAFAAALSAGGQECAKRFSCDRAAKTISELYEKAG